MRNGNILRFHRLASARLGQLLFPRNFLQFPRNSFFQALIFNQQHCRAYSGRIIMSHNREISITLPHVVGMKELDRDAFTQVMQIFALRIPARETSNVLKRYSESLLNFPRFRNVVSTDQMGDAERLVLFSPHVKTLSDLAVNRSKKQDAGDELAPEGFSDQAFLDSIHAHPAWYELVLDYKYWTAEQILRAIVPSEIKEVTTSFEAIGHIAHLNLREDILPFKHIIGQVLLDKNPSIKTVVNKLSTIDTTFRFFQMELLAGENNYIAVVKENNCTFTFDFSKVYWNSRLFHEHERQVKSFKKEEVICDAFCGVGPFALPAAKKGCLVYASDLNPNSYSALVKNIEMNGVNKKKTLLRSFNMDACEFIRMLVQKHIASRKHPSANPDDQWPLFDHVLMNLPASATEFLHVFRGLFHDLHDDCAPSHMSSSAPVAIKMPTIHCYCFTKSENAETEALERVRAAILLPTSSPLAARCHYVRDVAPGKLMYCVSFVLPAEVAFAAPEKKSESASKRQKIENEEEKE